MPVIQVADQRVSQAHSEISGHDQNEYGYGRSSLAGAIGYSDLTNVAKTMTQTAPAVSIFILIMAAYLAMSLTFSLIGNLYNRHSRFTAN